MSTLAQQRRIIAVSALITFSVGAIGSLSRDEGVGDARLFIGVGMAFMICSVFADFGSPVGAGFAALIMLSAILYQGQDALNALLKRSRTQTPKNRKRRRRNRGNTQRATAKVADNVSQGAQQILEGNI